LSFNEMMMSCLLCARLTGLVRFLLCYFLSDPGLNLQSTALEASTLIIMPLNAVFD